MNPPAPSVIRSIPVWVLSRSNLIAEALAALLRECGHLPFIAATAPGHAIVAIWDVRGDVIGLPVPLHPPTLALVDGSHASKERVLHAGFRGYLTGDEDPDGLDRAVRAVLKGELWAERGVLSALVGESRRPAVTNREHEVLDLLVQGLSNKEIGRRLDIAEKTVKVYVSSIFTKLDARNRAELIVRHARSGHAPVAAAARRS